MDYSALIKPGCFVVTSSGTPRHKEYPQNVMNMVLLIWEHHGNQPPPTLTAFLQDLDAIGSDREFFSDHFGALSQKYSSVNDFFARSYSATMDGQLAPREEYHPVNLFAPRYQALLGNPALENYSVIQAIFSKRKNYFEKPPDQRSHAYLDETCFYLPASLSKQMAIPPLTLGKIVSDPYQIIFLSPDSHLASFAPDSQLFRSAETVYQRAIQQNSPEAWSLTRYLMTQMLPKQGGTATGVSALQAFQFMSQRQHVPFLQENVASDVYAFVMPPETYIRFEQEGCLWVHPNNPAHANALNQARLTSNQPLSPSGDHLRDPRVKKPRDWSE